MLHTSEVQSYDTVTKKTTK